MKICLKIAFGFMIFSKSISITYAQNGVVSNAMPKSNSIQSVPIDSSELPSAGIFDINLGTSGFGIDFKKKISEKIYCRIGYSHLPFSFTKIEQVGNVTINGYYKARFNNVHFFADYKIFTIKETAITGIIGFSYFPKAEVDVHVTPVGKYMYGTINLNDGHMGDANINATWKGFAPFVGVGLSKNVYKHKFFYGFDIGTYYFLSAAKVDMITSGYLEKNEIQRRQIQDNLKTYTWLPTLQISLNYIL